MVMENKTTTSLAGCTELLLKLACLTRRQLACKTAFVILGASTIQETSGYRDGYKVRGRIDASGDGCTT